MKKLLIIVVLILLLAGTYFGYLYLRETDKDTPKVPEVSEEEVIKNLFVEKYDKDISEVEITIEKEEGNYIAGSVVFGEGGPGEGGHFLAKKESEWVLVYDGNGLIPCEGLDGFSSSMVPECYDENTDKIIIR